MRRGKRWHRRLAWKDRGLPIGFAMEMLERKDCPAAMLEMTLSDTVVYEGERVEVTLTLASPSPQTERIAVTTVAKTATYGVDYFAPAEQQVTFAPGQKSQKITIQTLRDAPVDVTEGLESFTIVATPATPSLGTRSAIVYIADYAPPPGISVTDVRKEEGNSGQSQMTFAVSLAASYMKPVTVTYATRDGSATIANSDYVATNGTLVFAPGETTKTVDVTINGDRFLEPDETFSLVLTSPKNGTLKKAIGVGTIINDEVDKPGFQITVTYDSTVTAAQKLVFDRAAARWSQIIVGDLPSVVDNGVFIDDVTISASIPAIDGPGGILGQAGPRGFRGAQDNYLPFSGVMQFDSADVAGLMAAGQFDSVILHEMGHVIGVGTIWNRLNLLQGSSSDPVFTGTNAVREYNTIFGTTATGVPVENSGGPGTAFSHWRESVFDNELMTGYLNSGVPNPISRVTVGQFQDLGYQVNYAAADPYTKPLRAAPPPSPGGGSSQAQSGIPVLKRNIAGPAAAPAAAVPALPPNGPSPKVAVSTMLYGQALETTPRRSLPRR